MESRNSTRETPTTTTTTTSRHEECCIPLPRQQRQQQQQQRSCMILRSRLRRTVLLATFWILLVVVLPQGPQGDVDAFQQKQEPLFKSLPWRRRHRALLPKPPAVLVCVSASNGPSTRRRRTNLEVIYRENPIASTRISESPETFSSVFHGIVTPIVLFVLQSFVLAVLWISWEDLSCSYILPSRHRTVLLSLRPSPLEDDSSSVRWWTAKASSWGTSTVHGLGFGEKERLALLRDLSVDELSYRKSYNEVMLEHREQRVALWKRQEQQQMSNIAANSFRSELSSSDSSMDFTTDSGLADSIHILCESLKTVWYAQALAMDYKWDELRALLRSEPFTNMAMAASHLRFMTSSTSATKSAASGTSSESSSDLLHVNLMNHDEDVIGFDWGSCAWRHHCGALADAQESMDELDALLGVLEPFEAIFCLDVVERSLRDMLAIIPPSQRNAWIHEPDLKFLQQEMPPYQPHPMLHNHAAAAAAAAAADGQSDQNSLIDDAYLKALQELRIEYD